MSCYGKYIKLDTNPFDTDNVARYDLDLHQYIVTVDYIKKKTGIDLVLEFGDKAEADRFIEEATDKLYDIIYSSANQAEYEEYRRVKEYRAAKDHNIRTLLLNAIVVYIRASIYSSIDAVGDEHGIILESGSRVEFKEYDDLSKQAKRKIIQTGLFYFGTYSYYVDPLDYRQGY